MQVPPSQAFQVLIKTSNPSKAKKLSNKFESGTTEKGIKTGVWEYYDKSDQLALKFNHDTEEVLFLEKDTGSYVVWKDSIWEETELDIHPRYIGSENTLYRTIAANIRYPALARQNNTMGKVYLVFEIDTMGIAGNLNIINDIGDGCSEEIIRTFQMIPDDWLVATKDNKRYKSRYIFPITFRLTKDIEFDDSLIEDSLPKGKKIIGDSCDWILLIS